MRSLFRKSNYLSTLWYQLLVEFGFLKLSKAELDVLSTYFPYYHRLSLKFQREFRERLVLFMNNKSFYGRGGYSEVSVEMKVLISATAIKVLFGFPKTITLSHFDKILVYPDRYYSSHSLQYHNGEVNPKYGIIVIAWKEFIKGLNNPTDGWNVGIHEFAHALKIENKIKYNGEYGFLMPMWWSKYVHLATDELKKIKEGNSIFRSQARENIHEFFAVSVEAFFENTIAFKAYHPEMYECLVFLLRQDPMLLYTGVNVKKDANEKEEGT
ncbi:zinc-dependent peptidase [Anditalea andensis]|uniref:DgsA anti-repressor MtfA n=1 Tax=Anditalea andensis TaxID=1048983 RepID=A0A074KWP6_9BACT|nr:zinc-dependent peptidase [Anditalea andensis]KEO74411.1 hypothetical protein EL17_06655 [Anditalea andensis]